MHKTCLKSRRFRGPYFGWGHRKTALKNNLSKGRNVIFVCGIVFMCFACCQVFLIVIAVVFLHIVYKCSICSYCSCVMCFRIKCYALGLNLSFLSLSTPRQNPIGRPPPPPPGPADWILPWGVEKYLSGPILLSNRNSLWKNIFLG